MFLREKRSRQLFFFGFARVGGDPHTRIFMGPSSTSWIPEATAAGGGTGTDTALENKGSPQPRPAEHQAVLAQSPENQTESEEAEREGETGIEETGSVLSQETPCGGADRQPAGLSRTARRAVRLQGGQKRRLRYGLETKGRKRSTTGIAASEDRRS